MFHSRAPQDVQDALGDIVFLEVLDRGEQHACNVERDIPVPDYCDMLGLVESRCWAMSLCGVLSVPMDEVECGLAVCRRRQGGVYSGYGTARREY